MSTDKRNRFDLSDGFGKEDISAIFGGIWSLITFIFKVIFYPYVWIFRMFGRSIRFIRSKKDPSLALELDERNFMETIPGFFILSGFFGGILFGILVFLSDQEGIRSFFDNIELTSIIALIGDILGFFLEIILWIIGIDARDAQGNVILDRFGLLDLFFDVIFAGISWFIKQIFDDPLMLFIGIGIIGFMLAIIWIIISETGVLGTIFSRALNFIKYLIKIPRQLYNALNQIYNRFNDLLGGLIIGHERLDARNLGFHKKVLSMTLGLGVWVFFAGIFVLITEAGDQLQGPLGIGFIFTILLMFGIGVGIVGTFFIVRILDLVSRKKYISGKETVS